MEYEEFKVRIQRGPENTFSVLGSGSGGDARDVFTFPITDEQLENFVLRVGRSRRGVRGWNSPQTTKAKEIGGLLFDSLFQGGVRDVYRSSFTEAQEAGVIYMRDSNPAKKSAGKTWLFVGIGAFLFWILATSGY